jgi:propionyl-CoA synthetase
MRTSDVAGYRLSTGEIEEVLAAREAIELVRNRIGPVASFKTALVVAGLPKTRSGKILRGTMRRIADGEACPLPATIDDASVLDEISTALVRAGYSGGPPG